MKARALDTIVCPACKAALRLDSGARAGAEILEGTLACTGCGATYPIRSGVPRFVPDGVYATSFGRQWTWFRDVQLDSQNGSRRSEDALRGSTGWDDAEYRGKRLLDAGVGAGRFAERAAAKGADVFGVDLTTAIDAAYRNIGDRPNVHLIQADIFSLPFRAGTFDLAYSIGVLHHTPDTRAAFERVAATVKPGGKFAVYLYSRYGISHRASDVIRVMTTRLPHGVMWALSAAAIPLYFLYRVPVAGKLANLAAPISMEPHWRWRWLDTFDWYTPTYQWKHDYPEVFQWFRDCGFRDLNVFGEPIRVAGRKAIEREQSDDPARSWHSLVAS